MQSSDKPSTGTMDANGRQPGSAPRRRTRPPLPPPPSLRWRARGGPGCCCPGRSARWPRPPSPSSSFCSASMPAATTRISGGRCPHRRRRQCRRDPAHPLSSWRRGYADRAALARQHAATAQATAGALFLAAGAASGLLPELAAMLLGTRDAGPAALGGIALAMGFGWPRMCMPERCMPGWPFANRRRHASAERALTAVDAAWAPSSSASWRGSTRHQDGVAHAPHRRAARALKPHPRAALPQKLAAGASVARHCTHAAGVSDAPHCAQNRPPAACARRAPQASAAWRG